MIKPCPCCGGKAEPISYQHDYGYNHWIECSSCAVRTSIGDSTSEVLDIWNKRTPSKQTIDPRLEAAKAIFDAIVMNLKGDLNNLTRGQAIWNLQMIKAIVTVEEEREDEREEL